LGARVSRREPCRGSSPPLATPSGTGGAPAAPSGAPTPIYVINGFYMAMRDKYTTEGAAIVYMLAEWGRGLPEGEPPLAPRWWIEAF